MKSRLREEQVEQARGIGLDDEEEDFLQGNIEEGRSDDDLWRIRPYSPPDQVRVPRDCGCDGDAYQEKDPVHVQARAQRAVDGRQGDGGWNGVLEVTDDQRRSLKSGWKTYTSA